MTVSGSVLFVNAGNSTRPHKRKANVDWRSSKLSCQQTNWGGSKSAVFSERFFLVRYNGTILPDYQHMQYVMGSYIKPTSVILYVGSVFTPFVDDYGQNKRVKLSVCPKQALGFTDKYPVQVDPLCSFNICTSHTHGPLFLSLVN